VTSSRVVSPVVLVQGHPWPRSHDRTTQAMNATTRPKTTTRIRA
jgi:hypothetical protein